MMHIDAPPTRRNEIKAPADPLQKLSSQSKGNYCSSVIKKNIVAFPWNAQSACKEPNEKRHIVQTMSTFNHRTFLQSQKESLLHLKAARESPEIKKYMKAASCSRLIKNKSVSYQPNTNSHLKFPTQDQSSASRNIRNMKRMVLLNAIHLSRKAIISPQQDDEVKKVITSNDNKDNFNLSSPLKATYEAYLSFHSSHKNHSPSVSPSSLLQKRKIRSFDSMKSLTDHEDHNGHNGQESVASNKDNIDNKVELVQIQNLQDTLPSNNSDVFTAAKTLELMRVVPC